MSTNPFANSKAALVFAATTIIGALAIVGTGDRGGALDGALERVASQRESIAEEARNFSEERTEVIEPLDPASGWGGTGDDVFGEYNPEEPPVAEAEGPPPSTNATRRENPQVASPGAIGGPVRADSPGVLVPREGGSGQQISQPPAAVVTSRTLTIEPK